MKKLFITIMLLTGFVFATKAQWVSPGEGITYDMSSLALASNGAVVEDSPNHYAIMQDVTISKRDILDISGLDVVYIGTKNTTVTIKGRLNVSVETVMQGDANSRIIFEDSEHSEISYFNIDMLGGISLVDADVIFTECSFSNFETTYSNGAVSISGGEPRFIRCMFMNNQGSGISSAANKLSSPQISSCVFKRNGVANGNTPQINLGPGTETPIVIQQCEVIGGGFDMVGGISISDLLGMGSTTIIISDNFIVDNRYGINQQGNSIASEIVGNLIYDNSFETNPMNGGSGISIYGLSTDCSAYIRNNFIKGNLWGITAINQFTIDMGTEDDWGFNSIHNNSNSTGSFNLYNNSAIDIPAVGNYWGTKGIDDVEKLIYHKTDDPSLGLVTYTPIWEDDGLNEIPAQQLNDNRVYSIDGRYLGMEVPADYRGIYIQNGKKYFK